MLRLRQTVISLTAAEVTEVVHRRRFRRYLELDDEVRIESHSLPERSQAGVTPLDAAFSPEAHERESTPHTDSGKRASSRPDNRVLLSADDSSVLSPFDQSVEEDISPEPEPSHRRGRQEHGEEGGRQRTPGTLLLCMRPKRVLSTVTPGDGAADPDDSAILRCSPATSFASTSWRASPGVERSAERRSAAAPGPASTRSTNAHPSSSRKRAVSGPPLSQQQVRDPVGGVNTGLHSSASSRTLRRNSFSGSCLDSRTTLATSDKARSEDNFPLNTARVLQAFQPELASAAPLSRASSGFRVYSDMLPASLQPRTPQNLPEARRQSRLQGAYTAPARRTSPQPIGTPTASRPRHGFGRRREPSPLGLQTPGFMSLYGGMENTEDSALFEEMAQDLEFGMSGAGST